MENFEPVFEMSGHLAGAPFQWFVAGGWALDLFVGRRTRDHSDVDVALARDDQALARAAFPGWTWERVAHRDGALVREPWREDEWVRLPDHELHGRSPGGDHLELLLLERRDPDWVYRRDPRVTLPWDRLGVATRAGPPALAPEVVLLFKARGNRARDQLDLAAALPHLDRGRRTWLRRALEVAHPGHGWLAALTPG